jgi:hypothetical protein
MQNSKTKLRSLIRNLLREILNEESDITELTTTGCADGYQTPFAFKSDDDDDEDELDTPKQNSTTFESNETNKLYIKETKSLFHLYRDHPDYTPEQKVGITVREVNKLLNEIEKLVNLSSRFKSESNIDTSKMWRTTNRYLAKLDEKFQRIAHKIKELR